MAHILQGYFYFLFLSFYSRWAAWSVLQCWLGEGAELGGPALTGEQRKAADDVQSLVTVQVSQGPGAALESRLLIWRDREHRGWTMRMWWHGCFKDDGLAVITLKVAVLKHAIKRAERTEWNGDSILCSLLGNADGGHEFPWCTWGP